MGINRIALALLLMNCFLNSCTHYDNKFVENSPVRIDCDRKFEELYESKLKFFNLQIEGEGLYKNKKIYTKWNHPLICSFNITDEVKKNKNFKYNRENLGRYSVFMGRDTIPRGNPRKHYLSFDVQSCKENEFILTDNKSRKLIIKNNDGVVGLDWNIIKNNNVVYRFQCMNLRM